jgi:hypothetical protein
MLVQIEDRRSRKSWLREIGFQIITVGPWIVLIAMLCSSLNRLK